MPVTKTDRPVHLVRDVAMPLGGSLFLVVLVAVVAMVLIQVGGGGKARDAAEAPSPSGELPGVTTVVRPAG